MECLCGGRIRQNDEGDMECEICGMLMEDQ